MYRISAIPAILVLSFALTGCLFPGEARSGVVLDQDTATLTVPAGSGHFREKTYLFLHDVEFKELELVGISVRAEGNRLNYIGAIEIEGKEIPEYKYRTLAHRSGNSTRFTLRRTDITHYSRASFENIDLKISVERLNLPEETELEFTFEVRYTYNE
jgi:hypothetical protein